MFFVAFHAPFWDAASRKEIYPFNGILDRLMIRYGHSIGFDVVESPFAKLRHETQNPRFITAYNFDDLYDGDIMWRRPLKTLIGVTYVNDWILTEQDKHQILTQSRQ